MRPNADPYYKNSSANGNLSAFFTGSQPDPAQQFIMNAYVKVVSQFQLNLLL
jgi:hypothetical protein